MLKEMYGRYLERYKVIIVVVSTVIVVSLSVVGARAIFSSVEEYRASTPEELALQVAEAEQKVAEAQLNTVKAGIDAAFGTENIGAVNLTVNTQTNSFTDGSDLRHNVQAMGEKFASLQQGDILQVNSSGYMVVVSTTAITGSGLTASWDFTTSSIEQFTVAGSVSSTASAATTYTLTEDDLLYNNYFEIEPQATGGTAWSLPASSTLTTLLANSGDSKRWRIRNTTTTVGSNVSFLQAVGTFLEFTSSSMTTAYSVITTSTGYLECYRHVDTDVTCGLSTFRKGL